MNWSIDHWNVLTTQVFSKSCLLLQAAVFEKDRLENKQREYRKPYKNKKEFEWWNPNWFIPVKNEHTKEDDWKYVGNYWDSDFKDVQEIFWEQKQKIWQETIFSATFENRYGLYEESIILFCFIFIQVKVLSTKMQTTVHVCNNSMTKKKVKKERIRCKKWPLKTVVPNYHSGDHKCSLGIL